MPWLKARLEPDTSGGTSLTGRVGLARAVEVFIPMLVAVGGIIALAVLAGGVTMLVSGHVDSGIGLVFVPTVLISGLVGLLLGVRSLRRDIPKLLHEVATTLDATITALDPQVET